MLPPLVGAALGVLILTAVGAITMQRAHELEAARDLVERTYEIREEMRSILSDLADAEAAERGFVLTGDERYLEPYTRAVRALPECFATLRRLMAGSPEQHPRLTRLEALAGRKLDVLERTIAARRRSAAEAMAMVASDEGRQAMDEMRATIDDMFARETRLLHARVATADARFRDVQALTAGGTLVAIVLLLAALVTIARAVRAREQARSQTQLETVTGNATLAMFLTDEGQHCTYLNPAAEAMTGYRLAELQGRPLHDLIHHTRPDGRPYPRAECPLDRALPASDRLAGEEFFVRKDGTFYPVAYTASPIRRDGDTTGTVLEVRDITAERQAAEERAALLEREREARVEAEAATRAKDEFLAVLSHELRTPLNAVFGYARMLHAGQLDEAQVERALEVIVRNANAQVQLIDDLLDVSRIVAGTMRLDVRPVELKAVIEAAVDAVRPAAEAKGIRLQTILDPRAGPINGDPDRLQQVVWNLLSNSVKFTPKDGRVQVQLRRVDSNVEIAVSDTGEGIPPDALPCIFDRFTQASTGITRLHGGLGIGLSLVKHLAESHGGSVTVHSEGQGKGTTFVVRLPLAISRAPEATARAYAAARGAAPPYRGPSLGGVRVVIVDDDRDAIEMMAVILAGAQADVRTCLSAADAFALVRDWNPDVLIADIEMPGEDGYGLIRRIRALDAAHGGRVAAVAVTAYGRSEDRMRTISAGFNMHLPKPVDPAELVTVVRSLAARDFQKGA